MELVTYDKETITIRFNTQKEWASLLSVLQTVCIDYRKLDREILNSSEEEVEKLAADIFELSYKARP